MDRRVWFAVLAGAAGGTIAIGLMELFAARTTGHGGAIRHLHRAGARLARG